MPFPAVCIRTSTERPEAMEKGCFVLAGIDSRSLLQAVRVSLENVACINKRSVADYEDDCVSLKVVNIIQSYTGYVNRFVWRKQ